MNKKPKIKEYGKEPIEENDLVSYEGEVFRVVKRNTGYTIRQYFSHSTPEKGPGPGWDRHLSVLEKFGVKDPSELPDEPYLVIELDPLDDN